MGAVTRADGPGLTVAAVARRLGVAPATLRTWDRRYGVGPTGHVAGTRRRYSPADLERLLAMRRMTFRGVTQEDAARIARTGQPASRRSSAGTSGRQPRSGGGRRVLSMPSVTAEVRGLARAIMSLDAQTTLRLTQETIAERGAVPAWDGAFLPVLQALGRRWATRGDCTDVEHLLSECLAAALRPRAAGRPRNERAVLLASAPAESHVLPQLALAAALAERRIGVTALGANVPYGALAEAMRRSGPAVVFVWSQVPATGDPRPLDRLPQLRPHARVLAGGPGWDPSRLGPRVSHVASLGSAVDTVEASLDLARAD